MTDALDVRLALSPVHHIINVAAPYIPSSSLVRKRSFGQVSVDTDSRTSSSEDEGSSSESEAEEKENVTPSYIDPVVTQASPSPRQHYALARNVNKRIKSEAAPSAPSDLPRLILRIPPMKYLPTSHNADTEMPSEEKHSVERIVDAGGVKYAILPKSDQRTTCDIDGCGEEYVVPNKTAVNDHLDANHPHLVRDLEADTPCPMCEKAIKGVNIGRHIHECHLKIPNARCIRCNQKMIIRGLAAMRKHLVRCKGAKTGPD